MAYRLEKAFLGLWVYRGRRRVPRVQGYGAGCPQSARSPHLPGVPVPRRPPVMADSAQVRGLGLRVGLLGFRGVDS